MLVLAIQTNIRAKNFTILDRLAMSFLIILRIDTVIVTVLSRATRIIDKVYLKILLLMYKKKLKIQKKNKVLPMDSLKTWFDNLLLKIKGKDNYLTTETIIAGSAVGLVVLIIIILLVLPLSVKRSIPGVGGLFGPDKKVFLAPSPTPSPAPSPTPTPIPLPRGPREYGVSNKYNPQLRSFKLSEFAPKIGEKQELTLKAIDTEGGKIVSIEVKLITDHKEKIYPMKLIYGTSTDGEWFATWITDDTHDYKYNIVFTAINDKGQKATINPTFR